MNRETFLQKHLMGELTEKERQEFDALLKSDPKFREEVEFQTDVKRAVTAEEDENFMAILSNFESEARAKNPQVRKFPTKWLVAASIALIAGSTYFFMVNQTASPRDLYSQNFKPYRNVTHPITRGEEMIDTKTQAFSNYAKGDYKEAVLIFTKLYASEKEPYYLFYKANALIQLNRAEEAIPLLQEHLETKDSLIDKSNWYLAMAYLQLEDTENAEKALNEVVSKNAYKAEEAKRLIDVL